MLVEPSNALLLRLGCLPRNLRILKLDIRTKAEPVPTLLIHAQLARRTLRQSLDNGLDLARILHGNLRVHVPNGERDGPGQLLDVTGNGQETRVAGEGGVDEGLAVGLGALREHDGVLATPAETDGADGKALALRLAKLGEEGVDDGVGFPNAGRQHPGNDGRERLEQVVSTRLVRFARDDKSLTL